MRVLENLRPERFFYYFEELCAIPHGSGNTKQISDYCMKFAKEHGLSADQDALNNVIIRKPASKGKEDHPTVILQGHLDMVCEKKISCDFDFEKEGLHLVVDGDYVFAEGTTLGADDGVAIAMSLAIMEDDTLEHPPLEAVFTVDEETGMYGAQALDASKLKGKTLLNIDNSEEGELIVGCAGGARIDLSLPLIPTSVSAPCYKVSITGLIGGHSGSCINMGRLNANKLMGDFLSSLDVPFCLIDLMGGERDNVIPSESVCILSTEADVVKLAKQFEKEKVVDTDPGLTISVEPMFDCLIGYDGYSSKIAATLLKEVPCGVVKMNEEISSLVQTSLNLGVVSIREDYLILSFAVRSSVECEKLALLSKLSSIIEKYGGESSTQGHYPAWAYRKESPLRDTMVSVFQKLYDKSPSVSIIHAGLECGILSSKIEDMDAISFGATTHEIHTVRERLSISSAERTFNYLCEVLKEL